MADKLVGARERGAPAPSQVLLLADGVWSDPERAAEYAQESDVILAADGAWAKARAADIAVNRVIGDLDSLTAEERLSLIHI